MRTFALRIIPITMIALALTACSGPTSVADDTSPGTPDSDELEIDPGSDGPIAFWIDRDTMFGVVTWGSSSCPPVPTEMEGDAAVIKILFEPSDNEVCTADMAPTTHTFTVPEEMTQTPTSVEVRYSDWPDVDVLPLD